jgi:hypothetical protein
MKKKKEESIKGRKWKPAFISLMLILSIDGDPALFTRPFSIVASFRARDAFPQPTLPDAEGRNRGEAALARHEQVGAR